MGSLHTDTLDAWRQLLRVHASVTRAAEQELREAGAISLAQYDVLTALAKAPGRAVRMGALADTVYILSRTGLTRFVDRLEADGLVKRVPCEDDRRGFLVTLTARGERELDIAWPAYERALVDAFGAITVAEARSMSGTLERVAR